MESIEVITNAIENKHHVIGIFIHLKKAFDTINHDILINKLKWYGIRSISVLSKAKHFLDHKSINILYNSLILPYLSYCAEILGNTFKSTLQPLSILQKRAIRIIHNTGYRENTNPLFSKSKILKLTDLVSFQTAQIMYRATNNILPVNIQACFFPREEGYNLRGELNLKHLYARSTLKTFCISICGVKLWNRLAEELRQCLTMSKFKQRYKQMVFTRYREEEGYDKH